MGNGRGSLIGRSGMEESGCCGGCFCLNASRVESELNGLKSRSHCKLISQLLVISFLQFTGHPCREGVNGISCFF